MVYYITKTNASLESLDLSGVEVLPLITLKTIFVPNFAELFLKCDSLIFTSKSAIVAIKENIERAKEKDILMRHWQGVLHYTLSPKSAAFLEKLGLQVAFIASRAYGDVFAKELTSLLAGKKPLFARAKEIASNLPNVLVESGIALESLIVYENHLIRLENPPKLKSHSIIFFSAPSHIRAFLLNFTWDSTFTALCIGETTKKAAFNLLGNAKILQSPEVSAASALEFARNIQN